MPAGNNDLCADPALMAKRQEGAWAADQTEQGECGRQPVAAAVGNFDGDDLSCLDILVAGAKDGDVTYLRGECVKEGETFAYLGFHKPGVEVERFSVGNDPVDVAASDLDGDGLADAVVALKDNIAVLWGKAEGAPFSTPVYLVTADVGPITPASVALEDVNNDGHLDIVIADSSRNQVVVYANAQGRDFLGPYGVPTGAKPVAARAVKLEGDACPALAVVNQDARSVTLHRSLKCEQ
jgi:hypothetical protein